MSGYLSLPGEGTALNALGTPLTLRAGGGDTAGALDVMEVDFLPGNPFPAHIHRNSDEAFYVLSGEVTATIGDEEHKVAAGTFAFAPKGVVHGFANEGTEAARVLAWQWPAPGVVEFVAALAELGPGEPDMERMMAIMARFDVEPVG